MPSVPVILRNWVIVLVSVLKDGPVRARPGNAKRDLGPRRFHRASHGSVSVGAGGAAGAGAGYLSVRRLSGYTGRASEQGTQCRCGGW